MKEEIKPINKRISTYRKIAGFTQQTAADALGIKKNTYARMELHGNPTPDMLIQLANLYKISPNLILFGSDGGQTAAMNEEKEPTRLNETPHVLSGGDSDLVLTTNEKNCIKACRQLPREQQNEVMALINKLYGSIKKNGNR